MSFWHHFWRINVRPWTLQKSPKIDQKWDFAKKVSRATLYRYLSIDRALGTFRKRPKNDTKSIEKQPHFGPYFRRLLGHIFDLIYDLIWVILSCQNTPKIDQFWSYFWGTFWAHFETISGLNSVRKKRTERWIDKAKMHEKLLEFSIVSIRFIYIRNYWIFKIW